MLKSYIVLSFSGPQKHTCVFAKISTPIRTVQLVASKYVLRTYFDGYTKIKSPRWSTCAQVVRDGPGPVDAVRASTEARQLLRLAVDHVADGSAGALGRS